MQQTSWLVFIFPRGSLKYWPFGLLIANESFNGKVSSRCCFMKLYKTKNFSTKFKYFDICWKGGFWHVIIISDLYNYFKNPLWVLWKFIFKIQHITYFGVHVIPKGNILYFVTVDVHQYLEICKSQIVVGLQNRLMNRSPRFSAILIGLGVTGFSFKYFIFLKTSQELWMLSSFGEASR